MLIYGYIPKCKKRKVSKATKLQHEEWLASIQKITTNFSKSKNKNISTKIPSSMAPFYRETPKYASLDTGFVTCAKTFQNEYTGDKIKGIGTMHKSTAVPVFSDNEAKDLASMRR